MVAFYSPELEVMFWEHGVFLDPAVEGPQALIPAQAVISQACRVTLRQLSSPLAPSSSESNNEAASPVLPQDTHIWATIGLTRVRGAYS